LITGYRSNCKSVALADIFAASSMEDDIVWIDLVDPTREEEDKLEALLGIEIPTRDDLKDIEPSSRLYNENGAVFLTASLVWKADSELPTLTDVGFILVGNRLVTIRYANPKSFALFVAALRAGSSYVNVHTAACPNGEIRGHIQ